MAKEGKIGFLSPRCTQNLKTGSHRSLEFCDGNFYWRKKNGQREYKQEEADSLLNNSTSHTQHLYKISKS